jgi:hypothetical protein
MKKERRKFKRVPFSSDASIISAGKSYAGSIQNLSEEGAEYLLTSIREVSKDFIPEKAVSLVLKDPSGKQYKLNCEVKWYLRDKGKNNSLTLGIKITNPPPKYRELIASLTTGKK